MLVRVTGRALVYDVGAILEVGDELGSELLKCGRVAVVEVGGDGDFEVLQPVLVSGRPQVSVEG